jgi:hypothetical protein
MYNLRYVIYIFCQKYLLDYVIINFSIISKYRYEIRCGFVRPMNNRMHTSFEGTVHSFVWLSAQDMIYPQIRVYCNVLGRLRDL